MIARRALPPAASSLTPADVLRGVAGIFRREKAVREREQELAAYLGVRHVFLVCSGKAAATLILRGLHSLSPERRRVVIPAFTCYSVPAAVLTAGLEVVPCDIDPGSFAFREGALAAAVDSRTLCILPTHLFGAPTALDEARALGRERGCFVVEDAAQALGVRTDGGFLGTIGDAGFFSLGRGKNVNAGAGGVIVTNDDDVAGAIARACAPLGHAGPARELGDLAALLLQSIFIHPRLYWIPSALPFLGLGETRYPESFPVRPLSGFNAGVLRGWRRRLEGDAGRRRANSAHYIDGLRRRGRWPRGIPYLRFPLLAASREARDALYAAGRAVGVGVMYPAPVGEIAQVRGGLGPGAWPGAKDVAERLVTLPTHHLMSARDRDRVMEAVGALDRDGRRTATGAVPC